MLNNKLGNTLSMMKTYKYILLALVTFSFASCFEDESTDATNPIAEITIDESNLQKVYNINKNDSLIITPVVTQKNKELPLSYAWELDQEIVSVEKDFRYKGDALGTYNGRLIVSNDDGKAFYTFTLNVNSPYEYGVLVLSKDADSRPHIAFMQEPLEEGGEKKFYDENCLEKNNNDQFFASTPTDIIQTTGTLILACQGKDDDAEDGASIYLLNEKTFVMENFIESKEYKDFKPTKLLTPQGSYEGSAYPVISADGKMYSLPTYNAVLQPSHTLTSTYAQVGFAIGSATYNDIVVWDNEVNALVCVYNGYGPYYCGEKYLLQRDSLLTDEYYKKNFSKLNGLCTLTPIHRTSEQEKYSRLQFIAIVKGALAIQKVIMGSFFWEAVTGSYGKYNVLDNGGFTKAAAKSYSVINETTPCVANATYETMLFADGNMVKKWYYFKNDYLDKAVDLLQVGSDEAIITSLDISEDHMKTYVAFYEPNQEGKNGSVWVFDTNSGEVLEQYNNVCYQPVKVMYKKK